MGLVIYNLSALAKKLQACSPGGRRFSPNMLAFYLVQAYCKNHTLDWRTAVRMNLEGNIDEMFYHEIVSAIELDLGSQHIGAQRATKVTLEGETVIITNNKKNVVFYQPEADKIRAQYHRELPQTSILFADLIESALAFILDEVISGINKRLQNVDDEEYRDELFQFLFDDAWEMIFADPKAGMFQRVFERELYSESFYVIIMSTIQLAISIAKSMINSGNVKLDYMGETSPIHIKNNYVLVQMG